MKKFILAIGLLAAGAAFAGGFGSVEYGANNGVQGVADSNSVKATIGTDLTSNVKADFALSQKTANGTATLTDTRAEGGLTYTQPIVGKLSGYGRVGLGQKFATTDNADFTYYSVEPGVKYAVNDALTVKAGYRFRNPVSNVNTNNDTTRTWRLGAEYALSKQYFVGVGFDRVRGDDTYNAVTATAGVRF